MSRKKTQPKKNIVPDPKFNSTIIPKLINSIMFDGKKGVAEKIVYDAIDKIKNKSKARLIRDGSVIYEGEILSLFREKNAVKDVKNGQECGISLKDFIDFKEKDLIESYLSEKIQRSI